MPQAILRLVPFTLAFLIFLEIALDGGAWLVEVLALEAGSGFVLSVERLARILAWLAGATLADQVLRAIVWNRMLPRAGMEAPGLLIQIVTLALYLLAGAGIATGVFGQSLAGILAASGAIGLVIGFAIRGLIQDVFSGIAINVDRSCRRGDWIELHSRRQQNPIIGAVIDVGWRTTQIQTNDGAMVVVPNSAFSEAILTNYSRPNKKIEFELLYQFDFAIDTDRVLRVLEAAAWAAVEEGRIPRDPAPNARISKVEAQGVVYKLCFTIDLSQIRPGPARHHMHRHVISHLRRAGLAPATPRVDTFTAPMPERILVVNDPAHRASLLARVALFSSLDPSNLDLLARRLSVRRFQKGEEVVHAGEAGRSMFIVVEGLVEVRLPLSVGHNAETRRVAVIEPGGFFGEMSALTGAPRTATLVTLTDTVTFEIGEEVFAELLALDPAIAETLSQVMAERKLRLAEVAALPPEILEERNQVAGQILDNIRAFFARILMPPPFAKAEERV